MSEKRLTSPESANSSEKMEHSNHETLKTKETGGEQLKPQAEIERASRKELEGLHEAQEDDARLELMSNEDEAQQNVRITKDDKQRAYTHTIKHVQSRLSKPSRRFSRVIHSPVVERASETMEKTIARPSGILGGALFATIGLAVMSFFARKYGFTLSGTELILFVSAGWLFGLIVEFVWKKLVKRI
jgi:hypothetical protein